MLSFAHLLNIYGVSEPLGEAAWASVLQAMPGWMWETNASYRIVYVSEGLEAHTAIKRTELDGLNILERARENGVSEAGFAAYRARLLAREPIEQMVYEKVLLNGERAVFLDSALPKFDKTGAFLGYRGMTFHLTHALASAEQRLGIVADLKSRADTLEAMLSQRNKELERSNAVLKEILNAMGEGVMVTTGSHIDDPENRIMFLNPEYLMQFGFSAKDIYPGRPFRAVVDQLVARGDLKRSQVATIGEALSRPGGSKVHLKGSGRTIYVKGAPRPGGGYVLVHTDMTEVETHNAELQRARRAADVANLAKSNFLASMSHEIRTPMNGIVGMTDLLALSPLDAEQSDYVDTVRSSALALTSLISDILDFSKVEAGKLEMNAAPMSVPDLCRDVLALMRPMAEAKGLDLHLEIALSVPEHALADQGRLRQILVNLLGNAIKFTMSGAVRLLLTGDTPLVIRVEDTGIGIPADKIDQVFAPFEQVQGGLQRQFEGTGLGLAITKQLVEAMAGEIRVTSTEGRGTVFRVALPLPRCAAQHMGQSAAVPTAEPPTLAVFPENTHILVAEDNRTNQLVVERMLARLGITCTVAEDGRAAVRANASARFDAILMDLSMPRLSGLDATRLIRRKEAARDAAPVPIIALTGNAFEQDKADARAAGMDGFLSKPLQLSRLANELARHIRAAPQSQDLAG